MVRSVGIKPADKTPEKLAKEKELERLLKLQELLEQRAQLAQLLKKRQQRIEEKLARHLPCILPSMFPGLGSGACFKRFTLKLIIPMRSR